MGVIVFLIILGISVILLLKHKETDETSSKGESRYSKTGNWADFDPGKDLDKVGDPDYPNAGPDWATKEEFLNNLTNGK